MRNQICFVLWASTSVHGASVRYPHRDSSVFTLPNASGNSERALALAEKRAGWEYGPSIAGNTAFYPAGSIGGPVAKDVADRFSNFQDKVHANVVNDSRLAAASIAEVCKPDAPYFWSSKLTFPGGRIEKLRGLRNSIQRPMEALGTQRTLFRDLDKLHR
jgi:hypothetical protein